MTVELARCAPASPFDLLPIELISHIFRFLIDHDPTRTGLYESISRVRPLALIVQISRRWYEVATSTPSLWSVITITGSKTFPSHIVELWLDRASNADLDVNIISVNPRFASIQLDVLPRLSALASQIHTLRAFIGPHDWEGVSPLLPSSLPNLREARAWINAGSTHLEPTLRTPLLTTLTNHGHMIFMSLTSLLSLDIRELDAHQWNGYATAFLSMPNLIRLRVQSRFMPPAMMAGTWPTPSLATLYIDLAGISRIAKFLSVLDAPNLSAVFVARFTTDHEAHSIPKSSFPNLKTVHVYHTPLGCVNALLGAVGGRKMRVVAELAAAGPPDEPEERKMLSQKHDLQVIWTARPGYDALKF